VSSFPSLSFHYRETDGRFKSDHIANQDETDQALIMVMNPQSDWPITHILAGEPIPHLCPTRVYHPTGYFHSAAIKSVAKWLDGFGARERKHLVLLGMVSDSSSSY